MGEPQSLHFDQASQLAVSGRPYLNSQEATADDLRKSIAQIGVLPTLERLSGRYSLAVPTGDGIVLARDRFGLEPICWASVNGGVVVSDTPSAALRASKLQPKLHLAALAAAVCFVYAEDGPTLWEGVHAVPAGHVVNIARDGSACVRLLPQPSFGRSSDIVQALVTECSALKGRSIAILMSGGLDSTCVAAAARAAGLSPTLLHITHHSLPPAERARAESTARHLDLPLHVFSPPDRPRSLSVDEISGPTGWFTERALEWASRHGIEVILTGHGSDTLHVPFYVERLQEPSGPAHQSLTWRMAARAVIPAELRNRWRSQLVGRGFGLSPKSLAAVQEAWQTRWAASSLLGAQTNLIRRFSWLVVLRNRYFQHFGLEGAHPFLANRVAAAIANSSPEPTKSSLRQAFKQLLPPDVLQQSGRVSLAGVVDEWPALDQHPSGLVALGVLDPRQLFEARQDAGRWAMVMVYEHWLQAATRWMNENF